MIDRPRCYERKCRHFDGLSKVGGGKGDRGEVFVCPAFPKGIPEDIAYGRNLHFTEDPRQEGSLTFEEWQEAGGE